MSEKDNINESEVNKDSATSLEVDSKVEEQTGVERNNEEDLLRVVSDLQKHMVTFTESIATKQQEEQERNEDFKQSVLQLVAGSSRQGSPQVLPGSSQEDKTPERVQSQDVRNHGKMPLGPTPTTLSGDNQYFQTALRGDDMSNGNTGRRDENDEIRTSKQMEEEFEEEGRLSKNEKQKEKLYKRMTMEGGTKAHVRKMMEEEAKKQNVLKRAEQERITHLNDPSIVHTETSLAWHLQWQKDMKQQVPDLLTSLEGHMIGPKSRPEDWVRWIDGVRKFAERSFEHMRKAKAEWRKLVHPSLFDVCYKFNYKYNIAERNEGIDDGRVFFRLRSTETSNDIDLPVGFRMEFNGNLDDLALEPFMILLTLMATPLDAQDFCLLVIKLMQKQFGQDGPLVKLSSTKLENVREHYVLTEDFLSHLVKYYNQVTDMVKSAKDGYSTDPDFKRGISLIYSDKSAQRDLLYWFIKNMGSPALKTWWSKRTEELHLNKSIKSVKKDSRYSEVRESKLLDGGKKPRKACVSLTGEVNLILDDFLEFYNVCEKVVQFTIENKDKSVRLPGGANEGTLKNSNLSALEVKRGWESGNPLNSSKLDRKAGKGREIIPDLVEMDGIGYHDDDSDAPHFLVSDSDSDDDLELLMNDIADRLETKADIQRACEQAFSNSLDDLIDVGVDVTEFQKQLYAFDATYYRGDENKGAKKLYDVNYKSKEEPRDFKNFCYHYILGKDCPGSPKCKGYGNWDWADGWRAARYLLAARQGDDDKSRTARKVIHLCMDRMEKKMVNAGITIPSPRVVDKHVNFKTQDSKASPPKMRKPPQVPRGMAPTREMAVVKKHQYHKNLSAISVAPDLCRSDMETRLEQKHAFKDSIASLPDHVYQNMLAAAVADDRVTQVFNFRVEDFGDPTQARLFSPST